MFHMEAIIAASIRSGCKFYLNGLSQHNLKWMLDWYVACAVEVASTRSVPKCLLNIHIWKINVGLICSPCCIVYRLYIEHHTIYFCCPIFFSLFITTKYTQVDILSSGDVIPYGMICWKSVSFESSANPSRF